MTSERVAGKDATEMKSSSAFGDKEVLSLHQLRLLEWMYAATRKRMSESEPLSESANRVSVPELWNLTEDVEPYPWQVECRAKWHRKGQGTVKVVTGAGKTVLALMIAESLQNAEDEELRVAIVVPTIILMHQWYDAILEHSRLPMETLGRLGGGYDQDFGDGRRILITVLASASQRLPKLVKDADVEEHLLLIADECHRAGAREMSNVFKTKRRWSLGLSATPEREDADDSAYNKSLLGKQLGPIIYQFTLADALSAGLIPKFTINHYGLPMTVEERQGYESLSRSITDAMSKLRARRGSRFDGDLFSWSRSLAAHNQGELATVARRFISDTSKRRDLLNHMKARHDAVIQLIDREFRFNAEARIILFHESIGEVMWLFAHLRQRGLPAIAEHSELPGSVRETGLELFRRGIAHIIVSARSLIEGFNVPAADVGIIVASSGSVRQRIQSLGRVLRRHRGPDGEEKTSCVHVLYASNSTEERIYGKLDWDETTGVDRNQFYVWDLEHEPQRQDGPPLTPEPTEMQVDARSLEVGSRYFGRYEGAEFSCDSRGNITNSDGQYALDSADLAKTILATKRNAGKFCVTLKRHYVLVRVPAGDVWETRYVTKLSKPLRFTAPSGQVESCDEAAEWGAEATVGDPYPFPNLRLSEHNLRFKQKSGGVISKRVLGGEAFARVGDKADNSRKGADAARLLALLKKLHQSGRRVSRIDVNEAGHVTYRESGQPFFVCVVEEGLEFPALPPA